MESGTTMCIPLTCRGLQVLGFPLNDKIYLCVHQLAIELWKAYDTPRVSVQRKIIDLGIKIISSDRNMIRVLRAAGIIENFRATMILLRDAEILCDALELSRRKRGLIKHALQTKHKPEERCTRLEERRAKKFTAKMNSMYNLAELQSQAVNSVAITKSTNEPQAIIHSESTLTERWAPSGSPPSPSTSSNSEGEDCAFDTLFTAQDPILLGGKSCQAVGVHYNAVPVMQSGCTKAFSKARTSTTAPKQTNHHKQSSSQPRTKPTNQIHSSPDQWGANDKPLSSPNAETIELDNLGSTSTSEAGSHSRQLSSSDSPERFLYLQDSSEEEDFPKQLPAEMGKPKDTGKGLACGRPQALSNKRVVATKLRHFAQTTSPRTVHDSGSQAPPTLPYTVTAPSNTSQPVVVKKRRGRPPKVKQPRPTALSSFATKKRAMSQSPSPDFEDTPTSTKRLRREVGEASSPSANSSDVRNSVSNSLTMVPQTGTETVDIPDLIPHGDTGSVDAGSVVEDDIVSIASVSTNSTNSSGQRRVTRRNKAPEKEPPPMFRFNELFSFYPPRLVVRDGELVPEHSLSVKKLDRNSIASLPESHPFLNWTLGCPVPGKGSRNGRKRKALS